MDTKGENENGNNKKQQLNHLNLGKSAHDKTDTQRQTEVLESKTIKEAQNIHQTMPTRTMLHDSNNLSAPQNEQTPVSRPLSDLVHSITPSSREETDVPLGDHFASNMTITPLDSALGTDDNSPPQGRSANHQESSPLIFTLPIDSLHCIASFLSPLEWSTFSQSSKASHHLGRDVFRRVWLHGFRCATEVVAAWKSGQHADARELSALYIASGVPIYPNSLGHSYHTLVWRMGVELKETQGSDENITSPNSSSNDAGAPSSSQPVDRFYEERYDGRAREGYNENYTYLVEKSLFWLDISPEAEADVRRHVANSRRHLSITPNRFVANGNHGPGGRLVGGHLPDGMNNTANAVAAAGASPARLIRSNSFSDLRRKAPKTKLRIHRHLLDQHLLGRSSIDDDDGAMSTAPINLSVDFFHPHWSVRLPIFKQPSSGVSSMSPSDVNASGSVNLLPAWGNQTNSAGDDGSVETNSAANPALFQHAVAGSGANPGSDVGDSDSEPGHIPPHFEPVSNNPIVSHLHRDDMRGRRQGLLPLASNVLVANATPSPVVRPDHHSVLSQLDLEVFSASLSGSHTTKVTEANLHLQNRFSLYHRRLETFLSHGDTAAFLECLLDFWDEFFPQTAGIHYYDRHTAVPRISCLHKFLTTPCPKAIGTVQCEIERIKINSKKKGVNMKGRLFPTYEYRLFIRDRPYPMTPETIDCGHQMRLRRDTVLMMAKNRGRKHIEIASSASTGLGSKKGANNYYLYMPQQGDVDDHFNSVNEIETPINMNPNGSACCPKTPPNELNTPILLGRLQSNFIGTEFQIFSPRVKKEQNTKKIPMAPANLRNTGDFSSDDEMDYSNGLLNDGTTSETRLKSRFSRLSLRRSSLTTNRDDRAVLSSDHHIGGFVSPRPIKRTRSSPEIAFSRPNRTSRRAIANTAGSPDTDLVQPSLYEEEDGAITYTANLLGSRPRIMDVCIPKVSSDGIAGAEWKRYLDTHDGGEVSSCNHMLNHFKQLQQRLDNVDENGADGPVVGLGPHPAGGDTADPSPSDFGLLALQNRPPWWNIELGSFVLNFGGRVSVASVKNFQLCDRNDQDHIMLQFGRIQGRHSFTMDFQYPLTAVQAFAIAISSLQSKISFG